MTVERMSKFDISTKIHNYLVINLIFLLAVNIFMPTCEVANAQVSKAAATEVVSPTFSDANLPVIEVDYGYCEHECSEGSATFVGWAISPDPKLPPGFVEDFIDDARVMTEVIQYLAAGMPISDRITVDPEKAFDQIENIMSDVRRKTTFGLWVKWEIQRCYCYECWGYGKCYQELGDEEVYWQHLKEFVLLPGSDRPVQTTWYQMMQTVEIVKENGPDKELKVGECTQGAT